MKRSTFAILMLALAGCGQQGTPASPSPVVATPVAATSAAAAPVEAPPVIVAPPVAADPPIAPGPVAPPARAFVRTDCDFSNLSAIRCFNPSDQAITLSAGVIAAGSQGCNAPWAGKHENVLIQSRTNGYFTLPGPACGEIWQFDMFYGARVGSCVTPDFTAERTYSGSTCPPPPPPPVCVVQPAGVCGPWVASTNATTLPSECTPKSWTRSCPQTCGAPSIVEGPVLSCEAPQ